MNELTDKDKVRAIYPNSCCVPFFASMKAKVPSLYRIQAQRERYLPTILGDGATSNEAWESAARRSIQNGAETK